MLGIDYLGRLEDLIAERKEWEEDFGGKLEQRIERWESGKWRKEKDVTVYATEYIRADMDPSTLLPTEWSELNAIVDQEHGMWRAQKQIRVADVILGSHKAQRSHGPSEFKIIRQALVLRYEAFVMVNNFCLQHLGDHMIGDNTIWDTCR
jgi:hypothetical protein